ncbi:hypothetical protein GMRT_13097 [Giardia muris]|uniref:Uncharacterized protein n=1 Tax=Giardia muris TaxID=5742 RepID=A0A4Z1SXT6_GIAMU|nr:hypothetical protein GMRT_13097 [Giardia muris]|eukprot:TNJ30506.1 hypothetical protein GMRT_13097 [Giardia muris]
MDRLDEVARRLYVQHIDTDTFAFRPSARLVQLWRDGCIAHDRVAELIVAEGPYFSEALKVVRGSMLIHGHSDPEGLYEQLLDSVDLVDAIPGRQVIAQSLIFWARLMHTKDADVVRRKVVTVVELFVGYVERFLETIHIIYMRHMPIVIGIHPLLDHIDHSLVNAVELLTNPANLEQENVHQQIWNLSFFYWLLMLIFFKPRAALLAMVREFKGLCYQAEMGDPGIEYLVIAFTGLAEAFQWSHGKYNVPSLQIIDAATVQHMMELMVKLPGGLIRRCSRTLKEVLAILRDEPNGTSP